MTNKIQLNIAGCSLTVNTPEPEQYVRSLAQALDEQVNETLSQTRSLPLNHALILTALDCMDRFKKADSSASNMRDQIRDYLSDAATAKSDITELTSRYNALALEFEAYKKDNSGTAVSARCDELSRLLAGQTNLTQQANTKNTELSGIVAEMEQKQLALEDELAVIKDAAWEQKAQQLQQQNESLEQRFSALNETYEILRQEAEALAQRNVGLQQQLTLLEQMIDEEAQEHEDIVENSQEPEIVLPEEQIDPQEVRELVGEEPQNRSAENEQTSFTDNTEDTPEQPASFFDDISIPEHDPRTDRVFAEPEMKNEIYDWQKDESAENIDDDKFADEQPEQHPELPESDFEDEQPEQRFELPESEFEDEQPEQHSKQPESEAADELPSEEANEADAQQQVQELFTRLSQGRSFDPPESTDSAMPDLGWTKDL